MCKQTNRRLRAVRRRRGALAAGGGTAACLLGLLVSTAPVAAFEPIEGVWQTTTSINGKFLIQQSAPSQFRSATIEGDPQGSPCRVDENNFIRPVFGSGSEDFLRGSGFRYTGRSSLWEVDPFLGTCTYLGDTAAQADIVSTDPADYRVRYCGRGRLDDAPLFDPSGNPAPGTNCTFYVRVREPLPAIERASQVVRLPRLAAGRGCRARSRVARLGVAAPVNEPLGALTVTVGARNLKRLEYPIPSRSLRLRLPRRRFTLTVSFETATRKELTATRRYRACPPR